MAIDKRHTQIKEGAGLEESRLNQEFIDFLQKYSTPVLLVLAVIALGFVGLRKYREHQEAELDRGFSELTLATESGTPSPESLQAIAREFEGESAVAILAELTAADTRLQALVRGIQPGAEVEADGTLKDPSMILKAEDREGLLTQIERSYTKVDKELDGVKGRELLRLRAIFGLAAVAESRGAADQAKSEYERAKALAKSSGFDYAVALAESRESSIGSVIDSPALLTESDLPKKETGAVLDLQPGAGAAAPVGPMPVPVEAPANPGAPAPEVVPQGAP